MSCQYSTLYNSVCVSNWSIYRYSKLLREERFQLGLHIPDNKEIQQEPEAGAEAEAIEEYRLLACSAGLTQSTLLCTTRRPA